MQKDSKFFDDIAKMASGAAGSMLEMKREMDGMVALQVEKLLSRMHLATKEEFDTLHAMIAKFREEQETIKKRLDALERQINKQHTDKY